MRLKIKVIEVVQPGKTRLQATGGGMKYRILSKLLSFNIYDDTVILLTDHLGGLKILISHYVSWIFGWCPRISGVNNFLPFNLFLLILVLADFVPPMRQHQYYQHPIGFHIANLNIDKGVII